MFGIILFHEVGEFHRATEGVNLRYISKLEIFLLSSKNPFESMYDFLFNSK